MLVLDADLRPARGRESLRGAGAQGGYAEIVCIDGVQLQDFDYIDISAEHAEAGVVTVVIKSLVFTGW